MIMSNQDKKKRKQGGGRAPQLPPQHAIKNEKQGTTGWNQLAKFAQDYPPKWWDSDGAVSCRHNWDTGDKKAYEEKKLIFL